MISNVSRSMEMTDTDWNQDLLDMLQEAEDKAAPLTVHWPLSSVDVAVTLSGYMYRADPFTTAPTTRWKRVGSLSSFQTTFRRPPQYHLVRVSAHLSANTYPNSPYSNGSMKAKLCSILDLHREQCAPAEHAAAKPVPVATPPRY